MRTWNAGMRARILVASFGVIGLCTGLMPVHAQAQATTGQTGASSGGIEEVTVTARRKSERLIDVPVSANVMTSAALARYNTTSLTSVANQVPQLTIQHAPSGTGAVISLRGIGSTNVDAGIAQEVTINIDGVPISRGRIIEQALFDVASVQVLKGPQALYFGKNSPAGVISIHSNDPGDTFQGYVRAGYETETSEYYGEAAVSIPLTDDLGIRVAFRDSEMTGGYIRDVGGPVTNPANLPLFLALGGVTIPGSPYKEYPGSKNVMGRFTLSYHPSTRFDVTFKFLGSHYQDRGDSMTEVVFNCGPGQTHPESLDLATGTYLVDPYGSCTGKNFTNSMGTVPKAVAAHYPNSNGGIPFTDIPTYLSSLTINYRPIPSLTVTSVTGYYKYNETQFSNYDETVFAMASGVNNDSYKSWSQEVRLASSFDFPVNFTAGLFYQNADRAFYQQGSIGYFGPDPATGQTNLFGSRDWYNDQTYSAFVDLDWKIADNLDLAGGARYTMEQKDGNMGTIYVHSFLLPANIASPPGKRIVGSLTEHNVSPQITLSWHPTKNVMLYAAYKTGFKSGGFSTPALIPYDATVQNQQFGLETARGGELGLKFSQMGGRLAGDVTAYHYIFKGLQLTAFDAATTSYYTQNAGSASQDGVEVNVDYRATSQLTLRGSAGYNHARYDSYPAAQCWAFQTAAQGCVGGVQNLAGQPLANAPDWVVLAGASYNTQLTDEIALGLDADGRYSSGYFISTSNSPYAKQGAYETLDMSAHLYYRDWDFALISRNVTDTAYAVVGGDKPLGPVGQVIASMGRPRTIELQVTRHF